MRRTKSFLILAVTLTTAINARAVVTSFTFNVPRKAPGFEISKVKAIVSVASESPVTFRITHANGSISPSAMTTPALSAGVSTQVLVTDVSGASGLPDTVSVFSPSNAIAAGDPARRKYTFLFNLDANSKVADPMNPCASTLGSSEDWTISVTGGPLIDRVCVQSLDHQTVTIGVCTNTQLRVIPQSESIATVTNPLTASNLQGCRVPLDCTLVLDRSGSMNSAVTPGPVTLTNPSKIQRLRDSVTNFVNVWAGLRTDETSLSASPQIVANDDKIGVVFFDSTALWLKDIVPASSTVTGLSPFDSVNTDINARVPGVPTAGATSIGGGLKKAADAMSAGTNRKVILLMSDGIQNTDPMARVDPMNSTRVQTTMGVVATNLSNQPPLQVYSLTVGSGAMVDPAINQAVANASNGFYMNTEADGTILPTLFLELLQNFVRFATVETLRLVSESVKPASTFQTTIPVTRTTQSIVFNLSWNLPDGLLRITVQPPNGAPAIVRDASPNATTGVITIHQVLNGLSPMGDWGVTVQVIRTSLSTVPFSLIVLGDDAALSSELAPVVAQYRPGDKIVVRARIRELETPITGLTANSTNKLLVRLLRPGASIGDLLSTSSASSTPPAGAEPMTPAEAKLLNLLLTNPDALQQNQDTLTLVDDGSSASGDAVAGDGTYSAAFPAQLEGHYNLLFAIEGQTASIGRFSRQQLRTVYVKPTPDTNNTQVSSAVQSTSAGNVLVVQITPRTKTNHFTGPGWSPYLWVRTSTGAFPSHDNLNGTYTANVSFTGSTPPHFDVHFIDDPVKIPETVTSPTDLPVPLGSGNVLVGNITPGGGPGIGLHRFFIDVGPNFPHGSFSNGADGKWSVNAGIERLLPNNWSWEAILGYHRFDTAFISNPHIWQLSIGGKRYFGSAPWHPFVDASVGGYRFDPGNTTKLGVNAGGGVLFDVTSKWGIEGVYQYHTINTSGSTTNFSTVQIGLRVGF
jgi:hypothetical protein